MAAPQSSLRFLKVNQVKMLNAFIKGSNCVRDKHMVESAVNSPINQQHYMHENDPARLAAVLSSRLIKNHPFADGNKRTALLAANLFLLQNSKGLQQDNYRVEDNDAITRAHSDVAMGKMEEPELAKIYETAWQTTRSG
ncbi:death on curing protein, partial [Lecanoromycetidae sp. Uapishka_2]